MAPATAPQGPDEVDMADETGPAAGGRPGDPPAGGVRAADRELAVEDLVYLNRMTTVGQVLPTVAHELNNALQVVAGLVEMIASRPDLPRDVLEKVSRIGGQAGRASSMIRDLVSFSRRDEGGVRTTDLARVVERAIAMRRYQLARARVAISLNLGAPGAFVVRADAHFLLQVLLNLLINAEHALVGREAPGIHIALRDETDFVAIEVTDNGPGLAADLHARAAEPFFTTKEHAAGLGVTVAGLLMALDGGRLTLEVPPEGGTRALMTLPKPRRRD